jgi:hypothetical protein
MWRSFNPAVNSGENEAKVTCRQQALRQAGAVRSPKSRSIGVMPIYRQLTLVCPFGEADDADN